MFHKSVVEFNMQWLLRDIGACTTAEVTFSIFSLMSILWQDYGDLRII